MTMVELNLTGKVAIVTGASRRQGIGAAVCRVFAAHGADVFFTHWQPYDRDQPYGDDPDGPDALLVELRAMGVRAGSAAIDFTATDVAIQVMDMVEAALGPASILVNNAVHSRPVDARSLDSDALDAHLAVNVRALALLSVEFVRRFQGSAGGRIISMTSGQGLHPMPNTLAYATSKGAVESFTTALAAGVAQRGITVNAIDPGATDTGWMSGDLKRGIRDQSAFGRIGQPDDAARLIVFLASEAGAWITGQIIRSRGA